jgi:glycosyltransferase involved in cell wall biosynthesis
MKTKIIVVGPALTRSGYGEQTRYALRALRSREDIFDIYLQPLQWGQTGWVPEYDEEKLWIDTLIEKTIAHNQQNGTFDASLQVTIPNEWKSYAPINIGYTAGMETTLIASEWITAINAMNKVIVISNHSKNTMESTKYVDPDNAEQQDSWLATKTDIEVVNYPVKTYESLPEISLNLECDTNFLAVAQWSPRKNIENTIRWFVEEFHNDEIGLILKSNLSKNCLMDREACEGQLKALLSNMPEDRKCKVYLLHGDMSDAEMHSLYSHEKVSAFVAIPHGEGYGLPIFEAVYSGLPVVSVGWSGQLDFLCNENGRENFYNVAFDIAKVPKEVVWPTVLIEESGWANAREHSYKENIRQCYEDIQNNAGHVAAADKYAVETRERFEQSKMYDKFVSALGLEIDAKWASDLSQIEIL